jgi:hypothetical protein
MDACSFQRVLTVLLLLYLLRLHFMLLHLLLLHLLLLLFSLRRLYSSTGWW